MSRKAMSHVQGSVRSEFTAPFEGLTLTELQEMDNEVIKRAVERLKQSGDFAGRSRHRQHSSHRKSIL